MTRRDLIALLGSTATMWPLAARAQQPQRMRRVGVLMNLASDDLEGQTRLAAFQQELQQLGWGVGENLRVDYRWAAGDPERFRIYAAELIALTPDVVLAITSPAVAALQQASNTVPIVFTSVVDPVGGSNPEEWLGGDLIGTRGDIASVLARYGYARCVNNVRLNAACLIAISSELAIGELLRGHGRPPN